MSVGGFAFDSCEHVSDAFHERLPDVLEVVAVPEHVCSITFGPIALGVLALRINSLQRISETRRRSNATSNNGMQQSLRFAIKVARVAQLALLRVLTCFLFLVFAER